MAKNSNESSRRQFVKTCMVAAGLAVVAPKVLAEQKRGGGAAKPGSDLDLPLVEPGKEMAAAMNYQFKKSEIKDAKLKADRQGVKFDDQSCKNCMLYTKVGDKNGEELGKCTIFPNKLVKSTSWCASWTKKA
jgi:hypothetical protein